MKILCKFSIVTVILVSPVFAMSMEEAEEYTREYYQKKVAELKKKRVSQHQAKEIIYGKFVMPYKFKMYGEKPKNGRSLHISMHGGGGAPAALNDQQWENQHTLYQPKEGLFLAPRAATNTWNLWHQKHIDVMFQQLIEDCIILHDVDPNKVYLSGYSAGGDGAYQLAPRMADRWAAAAMMAGHPNDAKPTNLTTTPFFIQCGGKDTAYKRNEVAREWGEELDRLEKQYPGYYPHKWMVYENYGHWMHRECKKAIPWMAKYTRNPWPKWVNWYQDDVTSPRFYWLANESPVKGQKISAKVEKNTITLSSTSKVKITLRLSDALVDLNQPVVVKTQQGRQLFQGKVERSKKAIELSLDQRLDKPAVATALLEMQIPMTD